MTASLQFPWEKPTPLQSDYEKTSGVRCPRYSSLSTPQAFGSAAGQWDSRGGGWEGLFLADSAYQVVKLGTGYPEGLVLLYLKNQFA